VPAALVDVVVADDLVKMFFRGNGGGRLFVQLPHPELRCSWVTGREKE